MGVKLLVYMIYKKMKKQENKKGGVVGKQAPPNKKINNSIARSWRDCNE